MFIDYSHKNKIIIHTDKKVILKSLDNPSVLKKEFIVLKFLEKENFTPKVSDLKKNTFLEEYLKGRNLNKKDLREKNIAKLAETLKRLHSLKLPPNIKKIIRNKLVVNNRYKPSRVYKKMFKYCPKPALEPYKNFFLKKANTMDKYFNSKPLLTFPT